MPSLASGEDSEIACSSAVRPSRSARAEAGAGDRVEHLAERLDLLGQRRLREQPLDLGGDAEIEAERA